MVTGNLTSKWVLWPVPMVSWESVHWIPWGFHCTKTLVEVLLWARFQSLWKSHSCLGPQTDFWWAHVDGSLLTFYPLSSPNSNLLFIWESTPIPISSCPSKNSFTLAGRSENSVSLATVIQWWQRFYQQLGSHKDKHPNLWGGVCYVTRNEH